MNEDKIKKVLIKYEKEIPFSKYTILQSNEEWYDNMANPNFLVPNNGKAPVLKYMEKIWEEAQKEAYLEIKKDLEDTDLNDEDCRNMLKVVVNAKIEEQ